MDIFDVLSAVSRKKDEFIRRGMNEHEALMIAIRDIAVEYHIALLDIKKLAGERNNQEKMYISG